MAQLQITRFGGVEVLQLANQEFTAPASGEVLLDGKRVPMILGFDPLYHFMHDEDAVEAIIRTIDHQLSGVFNVAGPPPIPLSVLARGTGKQAIPIPEFGYNRVIDSRQSLGVSVYGNGVGVVA